jgi:hypothetical protein
MQRAALSPDIYIWTHVLLTQLINMSTLPENGPLRAEKIWESNSVNKMLLTYFIALVEILRETVRAVRRYEETFYCELIERKCL